MLPNLWVFRGWSDIIGTVKAGGSVDPPHIREENK